MEQSNINTNICVNLGKKNVSNIGKRSMIKMLLIWHKKYKLKLKFCKVNGKYWVEIFWKRRN